MESTQGVVAPMDMDDDRARARDAASSVNCATERDADGRSVRVKRQMHMMMDRRAGPCLSLFSFVLKSHRLTGRERASRVRSRSLLPFLPSFSRHSRPLALQHLPTPSGVVNKDDALY